MVLSASAANKVRFSDAWKFNRGNANGAQTTDFNDNAWEDVCLPHTVKEELDYRTHAIYMGDCWYRKSFELPAEYEGKILYLEFGAAMQTAEVWVNGTSLIKHYGGYSPFVIDITDRVQFNAANVVAVKLNNNPSTSFPPGNTNPDFLYFGGLYQDVHLHVMDGVHISHPILADIPAGGGVFVTYPSTGKVQVKTHVMNERDGAQSCVVKSTILDGGNAVATDAASAQEIASGGAKTFSQEISVSNPKLWTPATPNLYTLKTELIVSDVTVDSLFTTIGIRTINFSKSGGLTINGQRVKLHGCNRHMAYPYIGNAVPASGQYRDALRIKEFGFDFVRMAHYMQPESFIDACDKLGIAGMACLPGWQYYNDAQTFRDNSVKVLRDMIRVYRNHPSVIVYESMHNESSPSTTFLNAANAAAHEEYPGNQMFTCGEESNGVLDVYVSSSQHDVRNTRDSRPIIISEYGDWEHGCVWSADGPITGCRMRMERSAGESALNTMRSTRANDLQLNKGCSWFTADGIWSVFDYQSWDKMPYTGCGDMDIFRIPKYSSYVSGSEIPLFKELTASSAMKIVIDTAGLEFTADGSDIAIVYASNVTGDVTFSVAGPGTLVGSNPAKAVAGIATILLRAGTTAGQITVSVSAGPASSAASVASHSPAGPIVGNRFAARQPLQKKVTTQFTVARNGNLLSLSMPKNLADERLPVHFTLYNAKGRVAGRWKLTKTVTVLNDCLFSKGVYIGRVESETTRLVQKVIW